ncbi:hypothetical protein [Pseudomonas citronellolis]|uniref:hypothetical protein n=1 Tax=Pseudomonas citronellolis TaxID=53408 RepID=UPI0023E3B5D6|nr:hypothetical protein [Pseudomonas citronellolis]MDF3933358.1 hypothetical protein [Pseudomonas citronellolis]
MDIRIERADTEPPTWKVFLGTFFIVCASEDEAAACAGEARRHAQANPAIHCNLPSPPPLRARCHAAQAEREAHRPASYLGT